MRTLVCRATVVTLSLAGKGMQAGVPSDHTNHVFGRQQFASWRV